jgi:hypothetical protein
VAWIAELTQEPRKVSNGTRIYVHVSYFDAAQIDSPSREAFHVYEFTIDANEAVATTRQRIRDEGNLAEIALNRAATLRAQFPVGTRILPA